MKEQTNSTKIRLGSSDFSLINQSSSTRRSIDHHRISSSLSKLKHQYEPTIKHGGSSGQGVGALYRGDDWDDADREGVDGSSGILERMYIHGTEQIS